MMKLSPLLALLGTLSTATATDYFFRYVGGNAITNGERLRLNNSIPYLSPGVTAAPHNPADHFSRIYVNQTLGPVNALLYVVPTNPHPPPVPGYYGLSNAEGVGDAFRLVMSYNPDVPTFQYQLWQLRSTMDSRTLLRYGTDDYGEWRWIAVKEISTTGDERWVPWWVRPTAGNMAVLNSWEYVVADLELVITTAPVNSGAPGGVQE